ncbi:MAG: 5-formyltetrahydrofolate cyclo-ligase [Candidatus Micrarchaeota archaeon]
MNEEKNMLRKRMLQLRKNMPEEEKHEMSRRIAERLLDLEEFHSAHVVALYLSKKDEVDTWGVVEEAAHAEEVLLPIVKEGKLRFVYYEKNGEMKRGPYGIMEPVGEEFGGKGIDLMVVPLVAVDGRGNRLGMGKGYYDRYLRGEGPKPKVLVGLCFDFQVVGEVPAERHDVPINIIITNKETIRVKR